MVFGRRVTRLGRAAGELTLLEIPDYSNDVETMAALQVQTIAAKKENDAETSQDSRNTEKKDAKTLRRMTHLSRGMESVQQHVGARRNLP